MMSAPPPWPGPPFGGPSMRDRGSTTLTTVLLTPVFVVMALMAFQAALWTHARTEARAVARNTAALVARSGVPPGDAERDAEATLAAEDILVDTDVVIANDGELVTARVTARAPGLIRGTSVGVDIVVAVPVEGFRP